MTEDLEAQLQNPENRRIFQLYQTVESRKFLEYAHSQYGDSLSAWENFIKDNEDPISALETVSTYVQMIEEQAREDPQMQDALDILRVSFGSLQEALPAFRTYYVNMARAIKGVSLSYEIKPEDVVANQDCLDKAVRTVFPRKDEFLDYHRLNDAVGIESYNRMRKAIERKRIENPDNELLSQVEEQVPSEDSARKLMEAWRSYRGRECCRIYGIGK